MFVFQACDSPIDDPQNFWGVYSKSLGILSKVRSKVIPPHTKYNPNRVHQASSPNNPPATDTGFLSANITMNIRTGHDGSVIGQVISAAPYSAALEFGTKDMLALGGPRPFMQPALEKNKKKIVKMFKDEGIFKWA